MYWSYRYNETVRRISQVIHHLPVCGIPFGFPHSILLSIILCLFSLFTHSEILPTLFIVGVTAGLQTWSQILPSSCPPLSLAPCFHNLRMVDASDIRPSYIFILIVPSANNLRALSNWNFPVHLNDLNDDFKECRNRDNSIPSHDWISYKMFHCILVPIYMLLAPSECTMTAIPLAALTMQ